jgi:hypothetical protein
MLGQVKRPALRAVSPTPQGLRRGQVVRLCWPQDEGAP